MFAALDLKRNHYENTPMLYTAIFHFCKNINFRMKNRVIFHIFAQNIDCGYTLEAPQEAVLTSTHNLCFGAKNKKLMYTPVYPFYCIKVVCKGV